MTYYDWICNECEVIWEEDHPIGTAPKKTRCEECGEMRGRNWGSVTTFAMKGDCHTNRVKARTKYEKGMDKDTAEEFYDESIKSTNRAINSGWKSYKKWEPNIENMRKAGRIRKRSPKEANEAKERARIMTKENYDSLNIDMNETLERKPQ
tara:strand:- start:2022 stop:2474 length:453 start_codon:yes stop_codon:yes gene_type:complete